MKDPGEAKSLGEDFYWKNTRQRKPSALAGFLIWLRDLDSNQGPND